MVVQGFFVLQSHSNLKIKIAWSKVNSKRYVDIFVPSAVSIIGIRLLDASEMRYYDNPLLLVAYSFFVHVTFDANVVLVTLSENHTIKVAYGL